MHISALHYKHTLNLSSTCPSNMKELTSIMGLPIEKTESSKQTCGRMWEQSQSILGMIWFLKSDKFFFWNLAHLSPALSSEMSKKPCTSQPCIISTLWIYPPHVHQIWRNWQALCIPLNPNHKQVNWTPYREDWVVKAN